MRLVQCPNCRAQYDVTGLGSETLTCRCGTAVSAVPPPARDAAVGRCAACGALVGDADRVCAYCQAVIERTPAPAGPVCPDCYARNPVRARHCTSCGVAFAPQPVRAGTEALECPVCKGSRMSGRSLGGLWVDECPTCHGLWAPGDVLDRLIERLRERRRTAAAEGSGFSPTPASAGHRSDRHAAWQESISYRRCPECGSLMARKNVARRSGVIVDRCADHGTWLDALEMEDIAAFALEGGLDRGVHEAAGLGLGPDPGRVAAAFEAEKLMAEERARTRNRRFGTDRAWNGIAEFLAGLLK